MGRSTRGIPKTTIITKIRQPKLLYLSTISKIQKMTDTEGEGAAVEEEVFISEADSGKGVKATKKVTTKEEEEVIIEADSGKGVKAMKKFTIKEEVEVTVVTGAEAASRAIIHLTDLTNSVIQPVVSHSEAVAPEVVHSTIKIGKKGGGFP